MIFRTIKSLIRRGPGFALFAFLFACCSKLAAHPMPNSVVLLKVHSDRIDAELQIPLVELQSAWGHSVNDSSVGLTQRLGPELREYLKMHIRPQSPDGRFWEVSVGDMKVTETQNPIVGVYRELVVQVQMAPPVGQRVRKFTFHYDVVLHQVVTHHILVSVWQDWERGQLTGQEPVQVGTISTDIVNSRVLPLKIDLSSGSHWTGFASMVKLGADHIAEGTDHLLFLLVLLLPAPLLTSNGRWGKFGGVRYSLRRLLTIITSFTIGHSVTLLAASLGWVRFPSQPVEILIAISIFVSAIHAARPLFPGRETWIAAGFGLIHGLAFASTLANLKLDTDPMVLSILGFNIGIEVMQLFIIGVTIPWLILLSRTPKYGYVRVGGALLALVASSAWLMERLTGQSNTIAQILENERTKAVWLLVALACFALWSSWRFRVGKRKSREEKKGRFYIRH
jgi:hypothetical protein